MKQTLVKEVGDLMLQGATINQAVEQVLNFNPDYENSAESHAEYDEMLIALGGDR